MEEMKQMVYFRFCSNFNLPSPLENIRIENCWAHCRKGCKSMVVNTSFVKDFPGGGSWKKSAGWTAARWSPRRGGVKNCKENPKSWIGLEVSGQSFRAKAQTPSKIPLLAMLCFKNVFGPAWLCWTWPNFISAGPPQWVGPQPSWETLAEKKVLAGCCVLPPRGRVPRL